MKLCPQKLVSVYSLRNKTSPKQTAFQWPNIQLLLHKKGLFFFFFNGKIIQNALLVQSF